MDEERRAGLSRRAFVKLAGLLALGAAAVVRLFRPTQASIDHAASSHPDHHQFDWNRFTERGRRAVQLAGEEAVRHGTNEVAPEHLLIGAVDRKSVAAVLLERLGVAAERVQEEVRQGFPSGLGSASRELRFTGSAVRVLEYAAEEATLTGNSYIGTEHLLVGILHEGESPAAGVLRSHGVALDRVRREVAAMVEGW